MKYLPEEIPWKTKDDVAEELKKEFSGEADIRAAITSRVDMCNMFLDSLPEECHSGMQIALKESIRQNYDEGEMISGLLLSYYLFENKDLESGGKHLQRTLELIDKPGIDFKSRAIAINILSYHSWAKGDYAAAFDKTFELLKQADKINDPLSMGWLHYALGIFNFDLKDYKTSIENYSKASDFFEERENVHALYGSTRSKTGIASGLIQLNKYAEASTLLEEVLPVYRALHVSAGISRVLNDLSSIEKIAERYNEALAYQLEAYAIRTETNHLQGKITSLLELGEIYLNLDKLPEAEKYLEDAKKNAEESSSKAKHSRACFLLSQLNKKLNQPWKALAYYEKFHELKEEVMGQTSGNEIKRLQNQFDREKSEKEAEIERLKNVELKNAHDAIADKNKEILDSIHYAKRIQIAVLPNETSIEKTLKRLRS